MAWGRRRYRNLRQRNRAVVIAVAVVGMVQVPVNEVVDVVAVRNGGVAAAGAVDVIGVMPCAAVIGGARRRVGAADVEGVLVDV